MKRSLENVSNNNTMEPSRPCLRPIVLRNSTSDLCNLRPQPSEHPTKCSLKKECNRKPPLKRDPHAVFMICVMENARQNVVSIDCFFCWDGLRVNIILAKVPSRPRHSPTRYFIVYITMSSFPRITCYGLMMLAISCHIDHVHPFLLL